MNKKGFTLVELLAVVVVLGLIITITATKGFGAFDKVKGKINEENIKALESAAESVMVEIQNCEDEIDLDDINKVLSRNYISCDDLKEAAKMDVGVAISVSKMIDNNYISGQAAKEIKEKFPDDNYLVYDGKINENNEISVYCSRCRLVINNDKSDLKPAYLSLSKFNSFVATYKSKITEVEFVYNLKAGFNPNAKVNDSGKEIRAWVEKQSDGTYKLYVGSENQIYAPSSIREMFRDYPMVSKIEFDNFDTSKVTNMGIMFYNCPKLVSLDLSGFDTSKVTDMSWLVAYCGNLESINVSSFDTSKSSWVNQMFWGCGKLKTLDISSFEILDSADKSGMLNFGNTIERTVYINSKNESVLKNNTNASSGINWVVK